jgi:hypothetical protein
MFSAFDQPAETMLLCTARYAVFNYICVKQHSLLTKESQDLLDDIFLSLAQTFLKAHKNRWFILNLETTDITIQSPGRN